MSEPLTTLQRRLLVELADLGGQAGTSDLFVRLREPGIVKAMIDAREVLIARGLVDFSDGWVWKLTPEGARAAVLEDEGAA